MPDQPAATQPTVLVKKADGTTVRMSLDEVMKMRGKMQDARYKIQETKKPAIAEATADRQETKMQDTRNKTQENRKSEISKQVTGYRLQDAGDVLETVFRWLDFSVADDLRGRLRSLIESRVKGVRTDGQFLLYAGKPAGEGGVGFTPEQADDLLAVVKQLYGIKPESAGQRLAAKPAPAKTVTAWTEEDQSSLLSEEPTKEEVGEISEASKESEKDALQAVIPKLGFPVPADLLSRLRTRIEARMKDVHNDDQFLEYVMKDAKAGGLGFTAEQAETALRVVKEEFRLEQKNRPMRRRRKIQDTRNKIQETKEQGTRGKQEIKKQEIIEQKNPKSEIKNLKSEMGKPVLHDVLPPKPVQPSSQQEQKKSVGPVDEIRLFTLVDFRRLSRDAGKAGELLLKKFETIREESHLLYLQAKAAWKESPLYQEYLGVLKQAMNTGKTVDETLAAQGKEGLTKGEFEAVVEVNKQLT